MIEPGKVSCHLARDLFIPYLAGDVSAETRAWLEQHLRECEECRMAFERAQPEQPAAPQDTLPPQSESPTDSAAQKLIRRVRARNAVITGILMFLAVSLVALVALMFWGVSVFRTFALPLPVDHPVPAVTVQPGQAATSDLTSLGLTLSSVTTSGDTATAIWLDSGHRRIQVGFTGLDSGSEAQSAYTNWIESYPVLIAAWEDGTPGRSKVMARTPRTYVYGWQASTWLVTIQVPSGASEPARLCVSIRDALFRAFEQLAPDSPK